jgi:tetratricopeptide (TPR) repeat protein
LIVIFDDYKDDYLINLRLGWLNYLNKNYNESEKYYHEAIRISNQSIESLLGLAYPLYAAGKIDELIGVYKSILKLDPNNYRANLQLGIIYLNKNDYLNAKILFEKIKNNFPSDFSANLYLGWTYYYLGSNNKAHKLFTNALIIAPNEKSAIDGYNLTK